MQCEACHGSGSIGPLPIPCADCGGSGVAHCCDGIREQRDPGDETSDWPDRLDRMEREVSGHGRECADDCVHPDHGHASWGKRLNATLDEMRAWNDEMARVLLQRSPRLGIADTHDEWRELNDGAD